MNGSLLKLLFLANCLIFTIMTNTMEVPTKQVGSTLPLMYQIVLRDLISTNFSLSPQTIDVISKNFNLQKIYNIIKNYSELGLSKNQAIEFVNALLKLNLEKINSIINFIEEINKLLNYENFPLPVEFAEKYSETALATISKKTTIPKGKIFDIQLNLSRLVLMQDIAQVRKYFLRHVIEKFILKYPDQPGRGKIQDVIDGIVSHIANLSSVFKPDIPKKFRTDPFGRSTEKEAWEKKWIEVRRNINQKINILIMKLNYALRRK